jgi:hypothetical protein
MTEQFAITVTASTRHGVISSAVFGGGLFLTHANQNHQA